MKAIILCAGYGTRLGDLTKETPKPMLSVNGKPILEYIILNCKRYGFDEIAINLHFKPEIITDYFGDGSKYDVSITYYYEPELLGTAGSVRNMKGFITTTEPFLVHYGDILTDQNFQNLLTFHNSKQDSLATLLVHSRVNSNSIIITDLHNRIVEFVERPSDDERRKYSSTLVNSGIALFNPRIYEHIDTTARDLPKDVYAHILTKCNIYSYHLESFRCAIDSVDRLIKAEAWIRSCEQN